MARGPIANPRLEVISSDDGFVVHDAEDGLVHYLNATAAIVFSLCDGEHDAESIALLMQDHFDLPEPPLADVESAVGQMMRQGVLQDAPSSSG